MTKIQKVILAFLAVLACSMAGLAIWLWQGKWQQPLGPALQIPTATPFQLPATWTPDPRVIRTLQTTSTAASAAKAPADSTLTPNTGLCGGPPVMNILTIGTDARGNNYTYG
ncbi:MAG TPA: hypothetical protein VK249_04455, partial [Anaerolineales bacterium]|nr:hypothetical protein [Anaerolineales bacterium]